MNLQGDIHTMPLPDLFQWLEVVRKTGTLVVENQKNRQQFFFDNGEVATALSSSYHTTDTESGVRVVIKDTLQWEKGHFSFEDDIIPGEVAGINLHLSPLQLVLDTFREIDEANKDGIAPQNAMNRGHGMGDDFHYAYGLRMAVVGQLLKGEFKVPLLPTVVNKVLEITQRENYSMRDLNEVIVNDPVITAQLLKHANSALYSRGNNIDSISVAVQQLGVQTVTNLILTLSLQSAVTGRDIFLEDRKKIWQDSLACALLARSIATIVKIEREQAFLCGLMIDFGKFILLSLIFELMQKKQEYQAAPRAIVDEVLETYHPKVGGIVAAKWKLPNTVIEAITHHHADFGNAESAEYVATANLCDALLLDFQEITDASEDNAGTREESEWMNHPAVKTLKIDQEQMKRILAFVPECQTFAAQMASA